jgi:HAD superfamily hydrolase (TIGR01509 family)
MSASGLGSKAFFFDLDGTLVDSRNAYLEAAKTAFRFIGQQPPAPEIALEIPRRLELKQSIDGIFEGDVDKFLERYLGAYYMLTRKETKLIPNIDVTLDILSKKAKLALITMRRIPKPVLIDELEYFGIARHFVHVTTAMDTLESKPSPEALRKTAQAMEIPIQECVMVGDSVSDVRAGKAAGTKTIAVLTGLLSYQELEKEHPTLILKDATLLRHVEL